MNVAPILARRNCSRRATKKEHANRSNCVVIYDVITRGAWSSHASNLSLLLPIVVNHTQLAITLEYLLFPFSVTRFLFTKRFALVLLRYFTLKNCFKATQSSCVAFTPVTVHSDISFHSAN